MVIENKSIKALDKSKLELASFKNIFDQFPGGIYCKDESGIYLEINDAGFEYIKSKGFTGEKKDILGKSDYDIFPENIAQENRNMDLQVINDKKIKKYQEVRNLADKIVIYLSIKTPLYDSKKNVEGIITYLIDLGFLESELERSYFIEMDEKKKLHLDTNYIETLQQFEINRNFFRTFIKALQFSKEKEIIEKDREIYRLNNVINNLPGSIYWKDEKGIYLGVNEYAIQKMKNANLNWENVIGKTDFDLFPHDVAKVYHQNDLEVMFTGQSASKEEIITLGNGQTLTQLSLKTPLRDATGKIIGIVGNTVDITHLKKIEAELTETKDNAETTNKLFWQFMKFVKAKSTIH